MSMIMMFCLPDSHAEIAPSMDLILDFEPMKANLPMEFCMADADK